MAMTESDLIARFQSAKKTGKNTYQACCPAHKDKNPSLSIAITHEKILLHCHAGCSPEQVVQAIGLQMSDLFFDKPIRKTKNRIEYRYQDETGKHLYSVHRIDNSDGKKIWQEPVNGHKLADVKSKYPYHLPEVIAARDAGMLILIAEGELCVDLIREKFDFPATTNSGGAGKWTNEHSKWFTGAHVAILPDFDEPGRKHAELIAESLKGVASSVKVISLPGLSEREDIADWIDRGGTREQLEQIIDSTPGWNENPDLPVNFFKSLNWSCDRFSDDPPEMPAIIENMLLTGIVAMIYSAGGAGKTTLFLYMCVKIALANIHRVDFFGHNVNGGNIVLVSAEDPDIILNKRLIGVIRAVTDEYGLEYQIVRRCVNDHLFIGSTFGKCIQLFELDEHAGKINRTPYFDGLIEFLSSIDNLRIVGIDTKARFSPGEGAGNHIATQEIQHYEAIASETGASVVMLHHTNKASRNGLVPGVQAFRDASALYDSVRACWYLRALTEDELLKEDISSNDAGNYTLFENTKNNYLPIVPPMLLKRNGFGFQAQNISPKLSKEEKTARKQDQNIKKLLAILQQANGAPWSLRKIIDLCRGTLSKGTVLSTLKYSVELEYIDTKTSPANGKRAEYSLTESGKNYETVPSF